MAIFKFLYFLLFEQHTFIKKHQEMIAGCVPLASHFIY
jgi:hypothetical protein